MKNGVMFMVLIMYLTAQALPLHENDYHCVCYTTQQCK